MILEDVAAYLARNGAGTPGADLFLADMPAEGELLYDEATATSGEAPASLVALYEDAGGAGVHSKQSLAREEARLRVIARGESWEAAMRKARGIYDLLAHATLVIEGRYATVRANHVPADLGSLDPNGRTLVSTNYTVKL